MKKRGDVEGRRIGKYVIRRVLGKGGMGTVFLAHQEDLKRDVALKVIRWRSKAASNEELFARFRREVRTCINFAHPHVIRIFDCEWTSKSPYLVMEYVDGETLRARVKRSGPFDGEGIASVGIQTLDALAYVHERGVIHRDLKPANLMIRPDGMVKLMDFGLIKFEDQSGFATREGHVVGSLRYLPPEAILQENFDRRSDLYQLGAVLYYLATGRSIYREERKAASLIQAIVDGDRRPASIEGFRSDLPADLVDFVERLMAHDLSDRFPDAASAAKVLDRISGKHGYGTRLSRSLPVIAAGADRPSSGGLHLPANEGPGAAAPAELSMGNRRRKRRRSWFGFLSGLAALVGVLAVLALLNPPPAPPPTITDFSVIPGASGVRIRWRSDLPCVGRLFAEREDGNVVRRLEGAEVPGLHHEFWLPLAPDAVWNVRAGARGHAYGLPARAALRPLEISRVRWDWLGPSRLGFRFRSSVPARSLLVLHQPESARFPLVSTHVVDHVAVVTLPGDWSRPRGRVQCRTIDDVAFEEPLPDDLRLPGDLPGDLAEAVRHLPMEDLALRVAGELAGSRGRDGARLVVEDALKKAGVDDLLDLLKAHDRQLFSPDGGWLGEAARDELYGTLCTLEDLDTFFHREGIESPFAFEKHYEEHVRILRPPRLPSGARKVKDLSHRKMGMLLPRGTEEARVINVLGDLQGTKRVRAIDFAFDLSQEELKALGGGRVALYLTGYHLFPTIVYELVLNGRRPVFVRSAIEGDRADLVVAEGGGRSRPSADLDQKGSCLGVRIPLSWLRSGANEVSITSRRVAGYRGRPATLFSQFFVAPGEP